MPQCSVCYADNPDNAKFCNQCGEVFSAPFGQQTEPTLQPASSLASAKQDVDSGTKSPFLYTVARKWAMLDFQLKTGIGIAVGFALLFGILALVSFFSDSSNPKPNDEGIAKRGSTSAPSSPTPAQPVPAPPSPKADGELSSLTWQMSEGNATIYNFIVGLGGDSRSAIIDNMVGAANRGLKYEEIISQPGKYYLAPVMFGGVIGAIHKINFDNGRAYMMGIYTLDGSNHLVAVVCPFKPHVANGSTGMIVGYVADANIQVNGETLPLVIARAVLSEKEARQYAAKLASDFMLGQ